MSRVKRLRKRHGYHYCRHCGAKVYGTPLALQHHEENCLKKQSKKLKGVGNVDVG